MDWIMEENIKSFSKWFVDNQSRIAKLKNENKRLKEEVEVWKNANKILRMHDAKMEYENKKLKESLDIATKCSSKEEDWIIRLSEENKKLKEDFDNYKKKVSEDMKIIVKNQIENIKLFDKMKGEYKKLEEEHKRLKEVYDVCNLDSINKAFRIANLEMENKKLKTLEIWWKTVEERIEIDKGVVRK